jgi:hypothetical protein
MKAAFQIKNILDITDPESEDRCAALDAFEDSLVNVLPEGSPVVMYDMQERREVTRPGKVLFFKDFSVLILVEDGEGSLAQALDAETPEGGITLAETLKETVIGPDLAEIASDARAAIGDENIARMIETSPGVFQEI